MTNKVAGLVLAAGSSTRFGDGFKLLLPYGEGTVVGACVRAAEGAGLDPIVVVVGCRGDEVRETLRDAIVLVVENARFRSGIAGSLAVGLRVLTEDSAVIAAAVLLGDEPQIEPSAIRRVVDAWRKDRRPLVRALYRDRPGHPVVVDRSLFESLAVAEGNDGARALLDVADDAPQAVPIDATAPVDIDTPKDYAAAIETKA